MDVLKLKSYRGMELKLMELAHGIPAKQSRVLSELVKLHFFLIDLNNVFLPNSLLSPTFHIFVKRLDLARNVLSTNIMAIICPTPQNIFSDEFQKRQQYNPTPISGICKSLLIMLNKRMTRSSDF